MDEMQKEFVRLVDEYQENRTRLLAVTELMPQCVIDDAIDNQREELINGVTSLFSTCYNDTIEFLELDDVWYYGGWDSSPDCYRYVTGFFTALRLTNKD